MSPGQYEIYELLTKLNGQDDVIGYIHSCMNFAVKGEAESIGDPSIEKLFGDNDESTLMADQTIIIHGFYHVNGKQLKAVAEAAKALGYSSPSEFIQSAIKGGAYSDMDHLAIFDGTKQMEETLKEA